MRIGIIVLGLIITVSVIAWYMASRPVIPPGEPSSDYGLYFSQVDKGQTPSKDHIDTVFCGFLKQAKSQIQLAVFDIDLPCVKDTLKTAHQKGIKVQIVTDSDHKTPEIKALKKEGIPVVFDDRHAFMHNKFVILDKSLVWTGSMNLTVNGARKNNNHGVWIRSKKLAKNYTKEFEEMFAKKKFGPTSPAKTPHPSLKVGSLKIQNYFSPEDDVKEKLEAYLKSAKRSIYFMAFSFTDKEVGKILKDKAKAGLKIEGIFEKTGSSSKYSQYNTLKRAKIPVKRDGNKYIMHHKVFVVDDTTVWMGSYNFSKNADRSNDENVLVIESPEMAAQFKKEYQKLDALAK